MSVRRIFENRKEPLKTETLTCCDRISGSYGFRIHGFRKYDLLRDDGHDRGGCILHLDRSLNCQREMLQLLHLHRRKHRRKW